MRLEKLIAIIIKGLAFLLPLFFLPWTGEWFEFNKQFLLWFALPLAMLIWLAKQVSVGKLKLKANPLNFPIIIFLALTFIASVFSLDRFASFFGYYGRFSDAWLGLLSLTIFYFLLLNTGLADSVKKILALVKLFICSAAAAAVIALLAMFGLIKTLAPDPFSILASPAFNPAGGSLVNLSLFLAAAAVLSAGILFLKNIKKYERVLLAAALVLFLMVVAFTRPETGLAKIIIGANLPKEAALDFKTTLAVSREVIKNNPVLGSGPGTFAQDFSLYRPVEFNQSAFWQIRFDKGASQLLEMAATSGLPAVLSYLLIISLAIYINLILLYKHLKNKSDDFYLIAAIFTAFVLLFFGQIFFASNMVLNFSFWLLLALTVSYWQIDNQVLFKEKMINFNKSVLFYRSAGALLLIAAAGWIALVAFQIKFFAADVLASRPENREKNLTLAIKLNPNRPNYAISLAKFYLNRAKNQASNADISGAIAAAKLAAEASPNSVQAQETLGMVYRDVRLLTVGSELWAVEYFSRALALEPANPVLAVELAKAYLSAGDGASAEKYLTSALSLKPDYQDPEAYYELGRYYFNNKKIDQAILGFNRALAVFPNHANSLFSLGIAYEAKGDKGQALKYYEKVLVLNPGSEEVIKKIKELSK